MKSTSPQLQALLLTKQFVLCDLYTFTLTSGTVLRYTTADIDIGDGNGNTFSSAGPYFEKVSTHKGFHAKVGLDTDTWGVTIAPRMSDPLTGTAYPDMIGDVPWMQGAVVGILDGATVQVDRQYFAAWPQPPWGLNNPFPPSAPDYILSKLFYGRVGQIEFSRTTATVTINSWMNLLTTTKMPANMFGSSCRHTLFDAGCALLASNFQFSGAVYSQPSYNAQALYTTHVELPPAVPPFPALTLALGRIVMTSGSCKGLHKRILGYSPSSGPEGSDQITLDYPFPFAINAGDAFNVFPGCDKSMESCVVFGNLINYGGFPYIPVPELGF